jgi:serine/threonine-protein kinase
VGGADTARLDQVVGGKYRITKRLGGGAFADVYEAVHGQIGQRFAIKIMRRDYSVIPELVQRFITEARAASAAGHPGIVQIFDIGELETGEPYLVMEFLHGEDLAEILKRQRRLRPVHAIGLCMHLLDALEAAHAAGVIHRDLKPENVMLVRGPGGEPWAKLVDFGIARMLQEGPNAARLTAQGTLLGTPYYVAPEQARGSDTVDARADVYATGAMLYEMVTGKVPYPGTSVADILCKVLSEPFPSARAVNPELPVSLEAVINRACARDRDQRYGSAAEFAAALRVVLEELEGPLGTDEARETTARRRLSELAAAAPNLRIGTPVVRRSSRVSVSDQPEIGSIASRATMRAPTLTRRRTLIYSAAAAVVVLVVAIVLLVLGSRQGTSGELRPSTTPAAPADVGSPLMVPAVAGSDASAVPEKQADAGAPEAAVPEKQADAGAPEAAVPEKQADAGMDAGTIGDAGAVSDAPTVEPDDARAPTRDTRRRDAGARRDAAAPQDTSLGIRVTR